MQNFTETAHSKLVGGSNAAARIACPASWQLEQKLPMSARKETNDYADEGSACHAAMAWMLNEDEDSVDAILGMVFQPWENHPMTRELIDEAIVPCLDYFDQLDAKHGISYLVEQRVTVPVEDGVFGTADIIGRSHDRSFIIDWKFGQGELVQASYPNEHGNPVPNQQLLYYAAGALATYPDMFGTEEDWPIELHVAQPRHRDGPSFTVCTVTRRDIESFIYILGVALKKMRWPEPPMAKGPHCRFMACKAICPLHTGPLLELPDIHTNLTKMAMQASLADREALPGSTFSTAPIAPKIDWSDNYAMMLDLANRIEPVLREWRHQAQEYLEAGGTIEGWKLVDKRPVRKWTKTDKQVERRLARMGLTKDERAPRELVSPPQAEKLLKALGKKLPSGYVEPISSGLTLAGSGDPRHSAKSVGDLARSLATALGGLTAGITKKLS